VVSKEGADEAPSLLANPLEMRFKLACRALIDNLQHPTGWLVNQQLRRRPSHQLSGREVKWLREMVYIKRDCDCAIKGQLCTPRYKRVSSHVPCWACGRLYGKHPPAPYYLDRDGNPYLTQLCTGELVKL
jgi:hypothetical protein